MSVAQNHFTKDETLVIGDRLYTDILSGITTEVFETALKMTRRGDKKDAEEKAATSQTIFSNCARITKQWSDHRQGH